MKSVRDQESIEKAYAMAKTAYAAFGINTDKVIKAALDIPVSVPCWQGDDVTGFEGASGLSGGGILATGNYPGRARNGDELRADAEFALSQIPGKKRFSLHAIYAETGNKKVSRDELEPEHFKTWMVWSKKKKIPLDFNPTFFSHQMAESGYTLSSGDSKVRSFWVRHCKASRKIAAALGANQGSPSINNIWIPDGSKDIRADRHSPRQRLSDVLDEIFAVKYDAKTLTDALESKLFGIGSESYVVGSHEFYLGYAASRQIRLCLDTGHFHPTENIVDKISAVLLFVPGVLLHLSRGVRWDSDHVPIFSDELRELCREVARQKYFDRVDFALDFFDASINRIAAWVLGARSLRKGLLEALLEPSKLIIETEKAGKIHKQLVLMEAFKTAMPFSAIWDKLCLEAGVAAGADFLELIDQYERNVLAKR